MMNVHVPPITKSEWVGNVGQRRDWNLRVVHVVELPGVEHTGTYRITIMKDDDNNLVIYKGKRSLAEKADHITMRATVKSHGEKLGVRQTTICIPKIISIEKRSVP